ILVFYFLISTFWFPYRYFHKPSEKRVGALQARFELRVELATEHPRVIAQFGDFDQPVIRRQAAEHHPCLSQDRPVSIVELEAMPVPFVGFFHTIGGARF